MAVLVRRRPVRAPMGSALVAVVLVLLACTGCTALSDQLAGDGGGGVGGAGSGAAPAAGGADGGGSSEQISTVSWAVADRTVSVVVRNDSREVLRRAGAVVRAVDGQGITLASSATMPDQDLCCTATHVAPGGSYGFYLDVGDRGDQVADVEIDYADTVWSATDPAPAVAATAAGLEADDTGATAVVGLTGDDLVPVATVQATLEDADGRLVAVVSGRWTCLQPGERREARLQLFHPVPEGTVVSDVGAFVVDDPAPPAC